jgi:uncharacterized protein (TIGR00369 family)
MKEIAKYSGCFVCGDKNDFGLKAKFYFQDNKAIAECVAQRHFEGYHDFYHGGITATLLDEVMIKALLAENILAMTAELTVKFHKAVLIGQKLQLEGYIEHRRGRLYVTRGQAKLENGEIVASATGKYLQVRGDLESRLQESPGN